MLPLIWPFFCNYSDGGFDWVTYSISWQHLFTQSPEVIPTHHYIKKMFVGLHLASMDVRVRLWLLSSSRGQRGKCGMMNANSSGGKENVWMPIITVSRSGLATPSNCLEKGLRGSVQGHAKEAAGMVTIRDACKVWSKKPIWSPQQSIELCSCICVSHIKKMGRASIVPSWPPSWCF